MRCRRAKGWRVSEGGKVGYRRRQGGRRGTRGRVQQAELVSSLPRSLPTPMLCAHAQPSPPEYRPTVLPGAMPSCTMPDPMALQGEQQGGLLVGNVQVCALVQGQMGASKRLSSGAEQPAADPVAFASFARCAVPALPAVPAARTCGSRRTQRTSATRTARAAPWHPRCGGPGRGSASSSGEHARELTKLRGRRRPPGGGPPRWEEESAASVQQARVFFPAASWHARRRPNPYYYLTLFHINRKGTHVPKLRHAALQHVIQRVDVVVRGRKRVHQAPRAHHVPASEKMQQARRAAGW